MVQQQGGRLFLAGAAITAGYWGALLCGRIISQQWFGRQDRDGFAYRSWLKGKGLPHDQFDGRPVIGICNTFSELNPCNSHFRTLAEQVKIGVYEAGGFPLEFPVMSLGETLLRPTAMLYRNLASMDVEESLRANPLDGVVLTRSVEVGDAVSPGRTLLTLALVENLQRKDLTAFEEAEALHAVGFGLA